MGANERVFQSYEMAGKVARCSIFTFPDYFRAPLLLLPPWFNQRQTNHLLTSTSRPLLNHPFPFINNFTAGERRNKFNHSLFPYFISPYSLALSPSPHPPSPRTVQTHAFTPRLPPQSSPQMATNSHTGLPNAYIQCVVLPSHQDPLNTLFSVSRKTQLHTPAHLCHTSLIRQRQTSHTRTTPDRYEGRPRREHLEYFSIIFCHFFFSLCGCHFPLHFHSCLLFHLIFVPFFWFQSVLVHFIFYFTQFSFAVSPLLLCLGYTPLCTHL